MKSLLSLLLCTFACVSTSLAHDGVTLGPNGGRIVTFSKNAPVVGEVTVKGGKFHVALLDKSMKPLKNAAQELTATTGDRSKPEKLAVEKDAGKFVLPVVKAGEWIIFQYKDNAEAKAVTGRMQYDTAICGECQAEEWLCKCSHDKK